MSESIELANVVNNKNENVELVSVEQWIENVDELFSIGLNRAITLISEAKPGRISSSLIKVLFNITNVVI